MLTGSLPVWAGWVWKRLEVRQNQPGEEVTSLLEMASLRQDGTRARKGHVVT